MSTKNKQKTIRKSTPKSNKPNAQNKAKENADTIYLIQNQNQVLKLKNISMEEKINSMKLQLKRLNSGLSQDQQKCQQLRSAIKLAYITQDMELQGRKKCIEDKIALLKGNFDIMVRKIGETREATILEENKIFTIKEEKNAFEKQLWDAKAQNQGTKVIMMDAEKQLQNLRENNEILSSYKKDYTPIEKQFSIEIEQRIDVVKQKKRETFSLKKSESVKILSTLLNQISMNRNKEVLVLIERKGLCKKILTKKISLLALIRRKYTLFIKNKTLQSFKSNYRPIEEQRKFVAIISNTQKRRLKNRIFRIWRNQSIKEEYYLLRKFQFQNQLEKLGSSLMKSHIYSTFNLIKNWQRNPLHHRSIQIIENVHKNLTHKLFNAFLSSLIWIQKNAEYDHDLDESAKQQSKLLTLHSYFSAWLKVAKQNKISNKIIKFKYFRELKKLLTLKNKRGLSEMLIYTNEKIKDIDCISSDFCHLKKVAIGTMIEELKQNLNQVEGRNQNLKNIIIQKVFEKKEHHQNLCLLKISKYLKGKMGKAFDLWKKHNQKLNKFKLIIYMFNGKMQSDINYAFSCLQKVRFEKLKKSISEKIASCEFSYNYLVEENANIKGILDRKNLDIEKNKFVNILRKLIRGEKEKKHKYFHIFMKNGLKFWKFRKESEKVNFLIEKKIKKVFLFMLQLTAKEKSHQLKIQRYVNTSKRNIEKDLMKRAFTCFRKQKSKIKKMKKILSNVFERNLQLNLYNCFNEIKRNFMSAIESGLTTQKEQIQKIINQRQKKTDKVEQKIAALTDNFKNKDRNLKNLKILACRKFFIRNSSAKLLHYVYRWKNKVEHENKVKQFAEVLERKTRVLLKNRFAVNIFKKEGEDEVKQLKNRVKKNKNELEEQTREYENFIQEYQKNSERMKEENEFHEKEGQILEKKTDVMLEVKALSFRKYWKKRISEFVMRDWKNYKTQKKEKLSKFCEVLRSASARNTFYLFTETMQQFILRRRVKINLSKRYAKTYRQNAGLAFRIWRILSMKARITQSKKNLDESARIYELVEKRFDSMSTRHLSYVDFRANDRKLRKIYDFMKKYTKRKLQNNKKKKIFGNWLLKGYQTEFYKLFTTSMAKKLEKIRKADKFSSQKVYFKLASLFNYLKTTARRKSSIRRLFIERFVFHQVQKLNQQFFTKTKNYQRYIENKNKNHQTFCVQKMIENFQKKRKNILCANFRAWRRNQFEMKIGKNIFKRLTRKSIMNRYEGMFYSWKVETEARRVLNHHANEGEVKKRNVEISRLKKFIDDFKKRKGLLLENQEGNFISSPRFQKKKQQEEKKENNLRYKFISRMILSMNGYNTPIRAYCNMQTYMKLREKYRKGSVFVLNHLRKPDLLLPFKTWRKATAEFRKTFENMERKELIKILNRQKDKMQMEYSKKLDVDEKIETQLRRHKVLSHQRDKKQKLCAHIFIKHAKKTKFNAFQSWRRSVQFIKDKQCQFLAERGQIKINQISDELRQLQLAEKQLSQSNDQLRGAVSDALQIAELVKRISEERDKLSGMILQKNVSCESLAKQNQILNSKLYLAQKEAMKLLLISNQKP